MEEDLDRLIFAARRGDLDEVRKCVLERNLNAQGRWGMTAVGEACRAGQKAVVRFLLETGADIGDVLHLACEYKDVGMVKAIVTSRVPLDGFDKYGKTPLHIAVERRSVVIVEELLKHGASVDKVDQLCCQSPLHIACGTECVDVVMSLLGFGAQTNLKDTSSNTPLHIACAKNKTLNVVVTLLSQGTLTDEVDRYGDTALHIACDRGRIDMVRMLLQYGASVNMPNHRHLTPLHLAVDSDPLISILLDYGSGTEQCGLHSCPCKTSVLKCQYEFHCSTFTAVEMYERYFIKVRLASVDYAGKHQWEPKDSDQWGKPERDSFSKKCLNEIEKLKIRKIGDTSCTYYDLLCRKKSALQNEKLMYRLPSNVSGEFPIYGDMIYCSYLKIPEFVRRQKLLGKCCLFFELTQFCQLPLELVRLILNYLPDADLENLVQICETSRLGSADNAVCGV